MKKRFSEEQIVKILGEQKTGKKVSEIARDNGISENTFYIWKRKYGDMTTQEVIRLKQLEEENSKLKKLIFFWKDVAFFNSLCLVPFYTADS